MNWRQVFNGVWVIRFVVGYGFTTATVVSLSFLVADYVVSKSLIGYEQSVENLQSSIDNLSASVTQANSQITTATTAFAIQYSQMANTRAELAQDIANRVEALRADKDSSVIELSSKIDQLVNRLGSTNDELRTLNTSLSSTNQDVLRIDGRQKDFEQFVLQYILRQGIDPKDVPQWYDAWGLKNLPEDARGFIYPNPDQLQSVVLQYVSQKQ